MVATFVVEDGSGVAGANSYVSEADADTFFDNEGQATEWDAVTPSKEQRLRWGTSQLDALCGSLWRGRRAAIDNPLDWPRIDVVDRSGYLLSSTSLPQSLKDATCVAALTATSATTLLPDHTSAEIKRKREKVGPIEQEIEYVSGLMPLETRTKIFALLGDLLKHGMLLERA